MDTFSRDIFSKIRSQEYAEHISYILFIIYEISTFLVKMHGHRSAGPTEEPYVAQGIEPPAHGSRAPGPAAPPTPPPLPRSRPRGPGPMCGRLYSLSNVGLLSGTSTPVAMHFHKKGGNLIYNK